jgi:hypothetical protein
MPEQTEEQKRDLALLKTHTAALSEHFDSVQIFVTRRNPEGTGTVNARWGSGDWFARYGHVKWWLNCQNGFAEKEGASDYQDDNRSEF